MITTTEIMVAELCVIAALLVLIAVMYHDLRRGRQSVTPLSTFALMEDEADLSASEPLGEPPLPPRPTTPRHGEPPMQVTVVQTDTGDLPVMLPEDIPNTGDIVAPWLDQSPRTTPIRVAKLVARHRTDEKSRHRAEEN